MWHQVFFHMGFPVLCAWALLRFIHDLNGIHSCSGNLLSKGKNHLLIYGSRIVPSDHKICKQFYFTYKITIPLSTRNSAVYMKKQKQKQNKKQQKSWRNLSPHNFRFQSVQQEIMKSSPTYIFTLIVLSVNIFCGKCSNSRLYTRKVPDTLPWSWFIHMHMHCEFEEDICKKTLVNLISGVISASVIVG